MCQDLVSLTNVHMGQCLLAAGTWSPHWQAVCQVVSRVGGPGASLPVCQWPVPCTVDLHLPAVYKAQGCNRPNSALKQTQPTKEVLDLLSLE
jgi:hypothetical protein